MPYVVKVTAYLDQNGFPVSTVRHAHHFETESLAETAAVVADGIVKEVKRVIQPVVQENKSVNKIEKIQKKPTKKMANQSWMKGGK